MSWTAELEELGLVTERQPAVVRRRDGRRSCSIPRRDNVAVAVEWSTGSSPRWWRSAATCSNSGSGRTHRGEHDASTPSSRWLRWSTSGRRRPAARCLGIGVSVPGVVRDNDGWSGSRPTSAGSTSRSRSCSRAARRCRCSAATTPTSGCSPSTCAARRSGTPTSPTSAAASASVAASSSAGCRCGGGRLRRRGRAPAGRRRQPRSAAAATSAAGRPRSARTSCSGAPDGSPAAGPRASTR